MDDGKKKITKKIIDVFVKKGFEVEIGNSYDYPSSKVVVEQIEKYANKSGETLEFTDKNKPVTFYLDKVLYSSKIKMTRGGYILYCKEV